MEKFDFEFLENFDVNSIDVATRESRWALVLHQWMENEAKAVKFSCHNADEKKNCSNAIRAYIKHHNYDWTIFPERNTYNIYVVRA